MHPAGCFGSYIAYREKSEHCQQCTAKVECAAIVDKLHPTCMRLLKCFHDGRGLTMAHHYLRPSDKKIISAARKRRQDIQSGEYQMILMLLRSGPKKTADLATELQVKFGFARSSALQKVRYLVSVMNHQKLLKSSKKVIELA